jgi:hypothetical protein
MCTAIKEVSLDAGQLFFPCARIDQLQLSYFHFHVLMISCGSCSVGSYQEPFKPLTHACNKLAVFVCMAMSVKQKWKSLIFWERL